MPSGSAEGQPSFAAAPAPHLDWASRIKAQHYHLQQQIAAQRVDNKGSEVGEVDLARWRAALSAPGEEARLRDYAAAMHHLATQYWEAPTAAEGTASEGWGADQGPSVGTLPEDMESEGMGATTTATTTATDERVTRKRGREEVGEGDALLSDAVQRRLYNDRVGCSLACVEAFLLGRPNTPSSSSSLKAAPATPSAGSDGTTQPDAAPLYAVVPLMLSRALKPLRRQLFNERGRMATTEEVNHMIIRMVEENMDMRRRDGDDHSPTVWDRAMDYASIVLQETVAEGNHAAAREGKGPPALYALDIGSCYGPFFHQRLHAPVLGDVPLAVTAIDLFPYDGAQGPSRRGGETTTAEGGAEADSTPASFDDAGEVVTTNTRVLKGDWLSLSFFTPPKAGEAASAEPTTAGGRVRLSSHAQSADDPPTASSVAASSYDVVFFCLLLSYMPTASLRYRACLHAYLALKPGGLLVIISTRTQGARRSRWEERWVQCLAGVGFTNVHRQAQRKIVILSFEKSGPQGGEGEADREAWLAEKMALPDAVDGLPITADAHM